MDLGLRHQGVLLSIVRGCDTVEKDDPIKLLCRGLRGLLLHCHCGPNVIPATFIERAPLEQMYLRAEAVRRNVDHLPHHYVMHLVHAFEVVAYCHPDADTRRVFTVIYAKFCDGLHVNPETPEQLDARLNADEATFARSNGRAVPV